MGRSGELSGVALSRGGTGLGDLLRLALAESGAERAYVAVREAPDAEVGIVAMVCSGDEDRSRAVSSSVLQLALSAGSSFICLDTAASPHFSFGRSVRQLALRSVIGAVVRKASADPPLEGALVLDSRFDPGAPVDYLRELVEGLAPVVGLFLTRGTVGRRSDASVSSLPADTPWTERLEDWISRVAPAELPVLIHGETGCGKERVAASLHRLSRRSKGPLVAVNCAALSESLLDAELFGAVRGAYTGADRDRAGLFARAHGGTLFLDEVGDMPPVMQAKLLRVLETGRVLPVGAVREQEVDVRVLAATHRDIRGLVRHETFRADLFHRLGVLEVHVPPLRDRPAELPHLVAALGPRLAQETGMGAPRLDARAWEALRAHDWPGNVRELHAVLARAVLRSGGGLISTRHLGLGPAALAAGLPLERTMIERALDGSPNNLTAAARQIGWTRQKLYRRMRALGIARSLAERV